MLSTLSATAAAPSASTFEESFGGRLSRLERYPSGHDCHCCCRLVQEWSELVQRHAQAIGRDNSLICQAHDAVVGSGSGGIEWRAIEMDYLAQKVLHPSVPSQNCNL